MKKKANIYRHNKQFLQGAAGEVIEVCGVFMFVTFMGKDEGRCIIIADLNNPNLNEEIDRALDFYDQNRDIAEKIIKIIEEHERKSKRIG